MLKLEQDMYYYFLKDHLLHLLFLEDLVQQHQHQPLEQRQQQDHLQVELRVT